MEEDIENPTQLVRETSVCLKDLGPEPAYKLISTYINRQEFKTSSVYHMAARVCHMLAKHYSFVDKNSYLNFINRGYRFSKAGLLLDDNNSGCAKHYAIFLDAIATHCGLLKWVKNSCKMKNAWLKAIYLNPGDAAVLRGFGNWCYVVANWSWIERKVATAIFNTLPTSSNQEALKFFFESVGKHSKMPAISAFYIARCYNKMKMNLLAKQYLEECLASSDEDIETEQAKRDAFELYQRLSAE